METKTILELIKNMKAELICINNSIGYRMERLMRNIWVETKSFNPKKIGYCLKNICSYALGNKQAFADYNDRDLIIKLIDQTDDLDNKVKALESEIAVSSSVTLDTDNFSFLDFGEADNKYDICPIPKGKRVAYFTNLLLDWEDHRPRYGGGERYCLNLSRLLKKNGFEIQLYQTAPTEFSGEYYGFPVKTIPFGEYYSEFNIDAANAFYEISLDYDYVIYNLPEFSAMKMRPDALMLCHGIWFDHSNYGGNIKFREHKWFRFLHNAFSNPRAIVSVDTNSINVMKALWPQLAPKMTFIPNFVDHSVFYPPHEERNHKKPVILFPRRSQINRGSRLMKSILEQVPFDVDFYWVGEGDSTDTQMLIDLTKKDKRLHYESATFDEMPDWYRKADIAVIPTIACEGTSLSCIEAMASGCATIATNVGGLTDLIFDELNGLSVNPTADDLAAAINRLITDTQLRKDLQTRGLKYSYNFSIEKWEDKWMQVLHNLNWIPNEQKKKYVL